MLQIEFMRVIKLVSRLALVCVAPISMARAQSAWPPPSATTQSRTIVSYEISATLVTRRAPNEWMDAVPEPLLNEMEADDHFAGLDLGTSAGNGILIRFEFDDMASYKEWNDGAEVQQMLAAIGQAIGYGYSRSGISMRRVVVDQRATRTAPPRRVPAVPPAAPPAPPPKATVRAASQSS